jgi:hypothetical protein
MASERPFATFNGRRHLKEWSVTVAAPEQRTLSRYKRHKFVRRVKHARHAFRGVTHITVHNSMRAPHVISFERPLVKLEGKENKRTGNSCQKGQASKWARLQPVFSRISILAVVGHPSEMEVGNAQGVKYSPTVDLREGELLVHAMQEQWLPAPLMQPRS